MAEGTFRKVLRVIERSALALGMAAALIVAAAIGSRWVAQGEARPLASEPGVAQTDVRDWTPRRVQAWREALKKMGPPPLATLRIRRIGVDVVVFDGTDDWTLNRAVGNIADTPLPGSSTGNIAWRAIGTASSVPSRTSRSGISSSSDRRTRRSLSRREDVIVTPEDVWVLDPTDTPSLTLVPLPVLFHRFRAETLHRQGARADGQRNSALQRSR